MKKRLREKWISVIGEICGILQAYRFECCAIVLGMAVTAAIYRYIDGLSLTAWSVEFWDAIASGRLRDYLAITAENMRGAPHGAYTYNSILPILPTVIWNFPVWLMHPMRTMDITSWPCVLWAKSFLIFCAFLSGIVCNKIVVYLGGDRESGQMSCVFFWGSLTLMISIGYSGQDEIVYMLFLLCAFYCVLAEKHIWSMVWMGLVVAMIPVMLLPCALIIIFHSRKLFFIILQFAVLFAPLLLEKLFSPVPLYDFPSEDYWNWFFGRSMFPLGNGNTSVFAIIILLVFAGTYFHQAGDETLRKKTLVYSTACIMTSMCFFSWLHFYRFFLCVPFLIICVFSIKDSSARTAGTAGILVFEIFQFLSAIRDDPCFRINDLHPYVKQMLRIPQESWINFYDLLTEYFPFLVGKDAMITSVAFACGIWLLWLTFPERERKLECHFHPRVIMRLYALCPLAFTILFCAMLYRTDIIHVPVDGDSMLAPAITGENSLEQYYKTGASAHHASVTIQPVTWLKAYPPEEALCMDIVDADTDIVIGSIRVLASQLPDNQPYTFRFRGIHMSADKWYIFRLYASEKIESEENYLFIMRSDDGTADPERHYAVVKENDWVVTTNYDMISQIIAF